MYLRRHTYVGEHIFDKNVSKPKIKVEGVDASKVTYVIEEAIYWRKANAIHNWFVNNAQDDSDNGSNYRVSREILQELYNDVDDLLKKKDSKNILEKVHSVLPRASGFFFGSTEVDEHYWETLEFTRDELKEILDRKDDMSEYYYHASW